jgi:hypothetical protein
MSDKSIVITEQDIMKRFDEMCQESLSPEVYSIWKDQIIPTLHKIRQSLTVKKVGMYGDTPPLKVGRFSLCEMTIPIGNTVWIEDEVGGDGGKFNKKQLESAIKEFYDKHL